MTDYLKRSTNYRDAETASAFDELSFWASRFGQLLFDHLEFKRGARILDLGFGTGFPLFELAHSFGPTCHVTGLDVWTEGIMRARLKQRVHALENLSIIEGDGAAQPFHDEAFDMVVSNLGINNFAQPAEVLAECFRVSRNGARLVMTTNLKGHYEEFYSLYRGVLKELGKDESLPRLDANEAHRGTRESVCALVEEAGFRLLKLKEDSFVMRFLDGSAMLRHSLIRFGFLDGWRNVVSSEEEEEVFSLLEMRLNEAASTAGELRMTVPMLYAEALKPDESNR
jgi:arsenite methyltransferase